jgi:hypothetical protein
MMNRFPVKFQQAESDKRNICHSKEGVRETTAAAVRTQQSRTAKKERTRRSNAAQRQRSAIAATTNEGTELDESEDENGTYEDEKMYTRKREE